MARGKSLTLHREYGVNPTIPLCWLCGRPKQEIVLLGNAYKKQAPMHMLLDKSPCDECQEWMRQGIILIEVDEAKTTDPQNPYRAGGFVVLKDEALRRMITTPELLEDILKRRMAFVPTDVWYKLGLPREMTHEDLGPTDGLPGHHRRS